MFSGLKVKAIIWKWNHNATNGDNGYIDVVKDMIDIRDGFKFCDVLDADNWWTLGTVLCCTFQGFLIAKLTILNQCIDNIMTVALLTVTTEL